MTHSRKCHQLASADVASGGAEVDFLQDSPSKKWNSSAGEAARLSDKAAFTRRGYLTPNYAALNKGFSVCAPRVHADSQP